MTSSLTQPQQLSAFNATRFLPLDLTQSVYAGLYPTAQAAALPCPGFTPFPHTFFSKELQEAHEAALKLNPLPLCLNGISPEQLNGISTGQSVITKTPTITPNGKVIEPHATVIHGINTSVVKKAKADNSNAIVTSSTSDTDSNHSSNLSAESAIRTPTQSKVIVLNPEKKKKEIVRDEAYWERRRKNNDAAKRSRDSRRRKEDEIAVRAALLEQENLRLRFEVERLRTEIDRHRLAALNSSLKTSPFTAAAGLAAALHANMNPTLRPA